MEGVPIVQLRTGRLTDGRSDLDSGPFRRRARSGAGRPRRSDGTQAVDTHVVDVTRTRPRQVTGTTETTCRLAEANFSLSRFPSFEHGFESFRYVDFLDFRVPSSENEIVVMLAKPAGLSRTPTPCARGEAA